MEIENVDAVPKTPFLLYLATLAIEAFVGLFRAAFLGGVFALGSVLLDIDNVFSFQALQSGGLFAGASTYGWIGFILGYLNVITSIIAFLGFGGGSLQTRWVLGARKLSVREAEGLTDVLKQVQDGAEKKLKSFSKLYMVDSMLESVTLIGTTLYVTSASLRGQHLPELLAHELGHIQHGDGSVILALRRLVFPPFSLFVNQVQDYSTNRPRRKADLPTVSPTQLSAQAVDSVLKHSIAEEWKPMQLYYGMITKALYVFFALIGGGIGVIIMSWGWASYFRQRDYFADDFAVSVGYKDALVSYLEKHLFFSNAVPYMLAWQPAHELRLDRIQRMEGVCLRYFKSVPPGKIDGR